MILELKDVLNQTEIARLREIAATVNFVNGRASNEGFSEKDNLQADPGDARSSEVSRLVSGALMRQRQFLDFVFPKRMMPPLLARYEPGMKYGAHADAALLATPSGPLRSDVSVTVFLNPPESYEGGELVLHMGARSIPIKFEPGAAVVYPSTTLHEVAPVRSGQRLVAITFIESFLPDEADREIIYELGEISALEGNNMDVVNRMRLEIVRQNLTRRWAGR
ncbi:MAG: Fe2+-dependent dioxygenase [Hyphomonadaceae bacterium]